MRYIMPIVEQLDRASSELAIDHPINNRLALILIDNAMELILHRRASDQALIAKEFISLGEERLTIKQRRMARGKFLEGKLRVLQFLKDISEEERSFISICHDYRNELYHIGLGHEDVNRAMAGRYYKLSCDLFARLKPGLVAWSSADEVTAIGKHYIEKAYGKSSPMPFLDVENLSPVLLAACPKTPDLVDGLFFAAEKAIKAIEASFQFLVQDNPTRLKSSKFLEAIQFHYDFIQLVEKEQIEGSNWDADYRKKITNLRKKLKETWRATFRRLPLNKWRDRASKLAKEKNDLVALQTYQALRNDMAYLENVIWEAAAELDAWIQLEIDHARGK